MSEVFHIFEIYIKSFVCVFEGLGPFVDSLLKMELSESLEFLGEVIIRPYVWPFLVVFLLQTVALVLTARKASWWKWLLLLLAEAGTVAVALALIEYSGSSPLLNEWGTALFAMGHVVLFSIYFVVTAAFALFTD